MKQPKIRSSVNRLRIQEAAIYLAAFFIFIIILFNRSPNLLRPLSMHIRFGFAWVIPLVFLVFYLTLGLSGWVGRLLSLTLTLSLFALALAGVWASGHTQSTYISGLIPLYDAQSYYVDALRLLAGRSVSEFSAARPLFAGFLAALLAITKRDLTITLMILTAINALACFFAIKAIHHTHGRLGAVFLLVFLFLYFRYRTVGTVMSESIGFALGVVSITLIWWSVRENSVWLALYGLFFHTLALNARPGPLFILPALLLWGSWQYRGPKQRVSWRFFLLGIAAIGTGFAASLVIKQFFGVSSGVPFSQFSYALYGLASGGNSWAYIFQVHPELREMTNPELTWTAYRLAFDMIRQHPSLIFQGAFHNWSKLFSNSWYSLFSYVGGENSYLNVLVRGSLYGLCLLGWVRWIRKAADPYMSFVVAGTLGILLSIPFVPPSDAYGMRLYAASIVFFGLLVVMGLTFVLDWLKIDDPPIDEVTDSGPVVGYSALLLSMLLIGPFLVHGISRPKEQSGAACGAGTSSVLVSFDSGTSIHLLREKDPAMDWMPVFHFGLFKRNVHSLPDSHFANRMDSIEPRSSLFYTLDYRTNRAVLIVIPTSMLPPVPSILEICGQWEDDPALEAYSIFISESLSVLSESK